MSAINALRKERAMDYLTNSHRAAQSIDVMPTLGKPRAQTSYENITDRINVVINTLRFQRYSVASVRIDRLTVGNSMEIVHELTGGVDYAIMGLSEAGVSDLDIRVYDASSHLIAIDTQADASPIVLVRPRLSGKYYVDFKLYSLVPGYSTDEGYYFAYVVGYR